MICPPGALLIGLSSRGAPTALLQKKNSSSRRPLRRKRALLRRDGSLCRRASSLCPGTSGLAGLNGTGTGIMTTFDKRKDAFESKFMLDQEQKFKAEVRRNKLLGLWAAERLGFEGDAAAAYARDVIAADFEEAGDNDVVRKVLADLRAKDGAITEQAIRAKMHDFAAQALAEAKAQR
jgi:hypothetical protein